ncbi:cell division protein FtsL [Rubrivivax gelatinosus]|uniref:Cell division protein FtsL n=1 Tax=Rubrivivax gelatinosus TaxID=28068 RepID=A0A4R2M2C7_RUBGE|nr:cell division protein FtsL [Rubrivivax gelatinosus]MBK1689622.1 cell division protein FtsL [Rubrivivax gelatinosus]TCP01239.1 cell division protein FtsL [Rubrivivax gelatinosus]
MTKLLNAVLLVLLLGSAFALVRNAYESRRLFAALDRAKNEQYQLEADYKRLDAERQAQATNLRVERVAREKLAMRPATPAVTQYVGAGAAPAASGGTP